MQQAKLKVKTTTSDCGGNRLTGPVMTLISDLRPGKPFQKCPRSS